MRYELVNTTLSQETVIDDNKYSVIIMVEAWDTTSLVTVPFTVQLDSVSSNSQTGFEVDKQRESEVNDYIASINK